jgi:signal transduction histidine kinase
MVVSGLFSFVIYTNINVEYNRIERFEKLRQEEEKENLNSAIDTFRIQVSPGTPLPTELRIIRRLDPEMIQKSRMRLITTLAIVNGSILLLSGFAGYFLAGRTLRPIKDMVDEQNRFVTDASHELRTPLTSLKSSIEVHLRDKSLSVAQAKNVLESNLEEVNNLQMLSDNLIQLTQYPNGTKKLFEDIVIIEVITQAVKKTTTLAKNKKMTVTTPKSDAMVKGEKQSLIELFVILLDNAIKYGNEKTAITITIKESDGKVVIAIIDEGMGIEEKDLPHIFDRFYRGDKSRNKRETAGYGLGLSIAKHIVTIHNGTISAKSILGKGTTFSISLPKV